MKHPNIYTFKHSELPPMTDEIQAEINGIEKEVGIWIYNFEGDYRALSALAETLAGLLNDCEEKMHCIRIVPNGDEDEVAPSAIGLTDLSVREKELIASNAMAVTVAVEIIANIFNCDFFEAARQVKALSEDKYQSTSVEELNKLIENMARAVREHPEGGVFVSTVLPPTPEN